MKKSLVLILNTLLFTAYIQAQENGALFTKQASNALLSYQINPGQNADSLKEAIRCINKAFQDKAVQFTVSAWSIRGDIYKARLQRDLAIRALDPLAKWAGVNDALDAYNAYQQAYELSKNEKEKTAIVQTISELQAPLINIGVLKYNNSEFEIAFLSFQAALESHKLLKINGRTSVLDEIAQYQDMEYTTALAAQSAGRNDDALKYFKILYQEGVNKPAIYEGLYNLQSEKGEDASAEKILQEGRQKFPDDPALLFAEINDLLKKDRLEEMPSRLKQAIAQEPGNIQLYITLGNVNDHLFQEFVKMNQPSKAEDFFNEAKKAYQKAQHIDAQNLEAVYALGSLYYNKAAFRTLEIKALTGDHSMEGMNRSAKLGAEVISLFDQSLPYFQKAESLAPNDVNTLLALSEIYTRKDEEELSQVFKDRLEVVKTGGKNPKAYFKR